MACHLVGAKPLSEPMQEYCQLDPQEQTSMKYYSKSIYFIEENAFECMYIVCDCRPCCLGLNELNASSFLTEIS